jgi:hypothetical protein
MFADRVTLFCWLLQNELYRLLEVNSLPRFLQGPLYKAYTNREPFRSAFKTQATTSRTYQSKWAHLPLHFVRRGKA